MNAEKTQSLLGGDMQNLDSERLQRADLCRTIRVGGRGSYDRHCWDIVREDTDHEEN